MGQAFLGDGNHNVVMGAWGKSTREKGSVRREIVVHTREEYQLFQCLLLIIRQIFLPFKSICPLKLM